MRRIVGHDPNPDAVQPEYLHHYRRRREPEGYTVAPGTRVLFVNNDSRRHDMASDPHPEHSDCRELEPIGGLSPGQSRETANLNTVKTCGFHDHDSPDNASLKGRIIIR